MLIESGSSAPAARESTAAVAGAPPGAWGQHPPSRLASGSRSSRLAGCLRLGMDRPHRFGYALAQAKYRCVAVTIIGYPTGSNEAVDSSSRVVAVAMAGTSAEPTMTVVVRVQGTRLGAGRACSHAMGTSEVLLPREGEYTNHAEAGTAPRAFLELCSTVEAQAATEPRTLACEDALGPGRSCK